MVQSGVTKTTISVSWSPSTDNIGVTGYRLYRNNVLMATITGTSYTFTGLTCGTTYTIGLEAIDAAGNASNRALAEGPMSTSPCSGGDTTPPSAPTALATSAVSATSITLSWAASTDNVGVSGYGRYRNGTLLSSGAGTSFTFTGLACGTTYALGVDAYDAAGNRSAQSSVNSTTSACTGGDTTAPSTPTGLTLSALGQTSVTLSWSASTDNIGVAGYGRYRDGSLLSSGTGTSYTFTGLACGTTYALGVDAYDAAGNRSARGLVTASTSACAGGSSVANVWVDATGGTCSRSAAAAGYADAAACGSFDAAYHAASAGDLVYVKGGGYPAQALSADASKTSAADVTIGAAPGETVTLGCVGSDLHDCLDTQAASHLTVQNVRTASGSACGLPHQGKVSIGRGGSDVTFKNIDAGGVFIGESDAHVIGGDYGPSVACQNMASGSDIRTLASGGDPNNITITGAFFHDVLRGDATHTECIYANAGDNVTINGNRFDNCAVIAIAMFAGETCWPTCTPINWTITNNWFSTSSSSVDNVQMIDLSDRGAGCPGYKVDFNTFRDGDIAASTGCAGSNGAEIVGNLLNNQNGCVPGGGWYQDYNVIKNGSPCGTNDTITNTPLGFTNETTPPYDLHLTTNSPALNRVPTNRCTTTDIDGQPRPQGSTTTCDAGTDER
jgi:chitodextrinase